jgi:hypothetical protein
VAHAIGSNDRHHLPDKDPRSDEEGLPAPGGTRSERDEGMGLGTECFGKESLDEGVAGLIRCTGLEVSYHRVAAC